MNKILLTCLLATFCLTGYSQNSITGKVLDEYGEGLPGANVIIKNTSSGTVTDIEGAFSLSAEPSDVLVFSFVGYKSYEVPVGSQSYIEVNLEADFTALNEIVVIGYGSQKKSVATAAMSTVDGDALEKINLPNVGRSLQGLASGVTVSGASGQPGSNPTILIRGVGTNGNNQPLVVIDGFQGGDLSTINPADIESVQILKDAASTAIYGTKGANGVIYVTTKSGKGKKLNMQYNGSYVSQSAWKVPEMLNAQEYVDLINEKYTNGGTSLPVGFPTSSANLPIDTDWMSEIFEPATLQNHNLSISKGGDKGNFFTSLSYLDQEGIIQPEKSNLKRLTLRINSQNNVNEFLSIGQNLTVVGTETMTIPENNEFGTPVADAIVYDPLTPVFDPNAQFGFAQSPFVQKEYVNPFSRIFINNNESKSHNVYGNIYLDVKPLEWVKFRTDFAANYFNVAGDFYSPAYNLTPAFFQTNSNVANTYYTNFRWQWENYVTLNKEFGDHAVEVVLGTTAIQFDQKFFGGSGQGLPPEALQNENLRFIDLTPDSTRLSYGGEAVRESNTSFFARTLYNFKEKYLFTASMRRDGSSQFGPANRYATFLAFSAGWVISSENFWNLTTIDFLKLRASYGSNGNDRIGSLNYVPRIGLATTYQFGDASNQTVYNGAAPVQLANPLVAWEESIQTDVGVELRLFDSKVAIELDYYTKVTDGLLILNQSTPVLAGNNPSFTNIGEVKNSGFEFKIDYNNNIGDLEFGISLNGATLKNEVITVDGQAGLFNGYNWPVRNAFITRMEAGEPLFYFRGYQTDGIFRSQADVFSYINSDGDPIMPNAEPGDLKMVDTNGDGEITPDDWTNIGSPWADFTFGINLTAQYKSFDLSMLVAGQLGNEIYRTFERQDVPNNNYTAEWKDRWSESNPGGSYPRVTTGPGAAFNNSPSDFYVEDGSFMRIKNLQIGYTVPTNIINKIKLTKARVYFSADNLLTLTGYSGFDPEIGVPNYGVAAAGIDRGFYPQVRSLGGGIQITF